MNPNLYAISIGQMFAEQTAAAIKAVEVHQQRGRDYIASLTTIPTTPQVVAQWSTVDVVGEVMRDVEQQRRDMMKRAIAATDVRTTLPTLDHYGIDPEFIERLRREQQVHDSITAASLPPLRRKR